MTETDLTTTKQEIDVAKGMAVAAANRLDRHNKFLKVLYSFLDKSCIHIFAGKARFNWKTANQAIHVFGIKLNVTFAGKHEMEDDEGKYYIFQHDARAWIEDADGKVIAEVTMPGYFSTRDPFFGVKDKKIKRLEDVDVQDVLRASATEARKKAVFALLGLGEPTKDDLKKLGVEVDVINTITFNSGGSGAGTTTGQSPSSAGAPETAPSSSASSTSGYTTISEKQAKMLYAIYKDSVLTEDEFTAWLRENLDLDTTGKYLSRIKPEQFDQVLEYLRANQDGPAEQPKQDGIKF